MYDYILKSVLLKEIFYPEDLKCDWICMLPSIECKMCGELDLETTNANIKNIELLRYSTCALFRG